MIKVIFLDIDGVLNHELFMRGISKYPRSKKEPRPLNMLDRGSIEILNSLIDATGAKVVVTSVWRKNHTQEELQKLLEQKGFTGEIIGYTPQLGEGNLRGNEILKWIKTNEALIGKSYDEYKEYVILDDDSDVLYWQKDNFLLIDRYCGITPSTVFRATKILKQIQTGVDLGI